MSQPKRNDKAKALASKGQAPQGADSVQVWSELWSPLRVVGFEKVDGHVVKTGCTIYPGQNSIDRAAWDRAKKQQLIAKHLDARHIGEGVIREFARKNFEDGQAAPKSHAAILSSNTAKLKATHGAYEVASR